MFYQIERIEMVYKAVEKFARQILPAEFEDLTQEIVMRLWSRRDRLPRLFGPAYLRTVVRNGAYDFIRKKRKANRHIQYFFNHDGSLSPFGRPDLSLSVAEPVEAYREQRDLVIDANEAMSKLSKEHRSALELRAAGMECDEIAVVLGIPATTARTRLFYARKQLNKIIGG
jgi:RNA polymerase sigma factor (sigma-70 family)